MDFCLYSIIKRRRRICLFTPSIYFGAPDAILQILIAYKIFQFSTIYGLKSRIMNSFLMFLNKVTRIILKIFPIEITKNHSYIFLFALLWYWVWEVRKWFVFAEMCTHNWTHHQSINQLLMLKEFIIKTHSNVATSIISFGIARIMKL